MTWHSYPHNRPLVAQQWAGARVWARKQQTQTQISQPAHRKRWAFCFWKDGREADAAGLLNLFTPKGVTWVRIPLLPPWMGWYIGRSGCLENSYGAKAPLGVQLPPHPPRFCSSQRCWTQLLRLNTPRRKPECELGSNPSDRARVRCQL